MPTLARIRIPALADLVEQLRYAPREALRRHVDAATTLALDIDPALTYPEDWVAYRLTGFRPSMDDPSLLVGEALLSDLSAVVEHLTEYSGCLDTDVPTPALDYDALCARWSVSRRTVDRYRRRGLIAWRTRTPAGSTRLLFPERWVRRFEERDADLIRRAGTFDRIPREEEAAILAAARREVEQSPVALTRVAEILAPRFGRATETIRQLLIRHDRDAPEPLFRHVDSLDGEDRAAIARAFEEGQPIAAMCRRFQRSRGTIYRIVNERRAELLRHAVTAPADDPPDEATLARLLEHPAASSELDVLPDPDATSFLAAGRRDAPVPARDEHARAAALDALEARAAGIVASLPRYDPPATLLDRAETDLRWVCLLRVVLLQTQRPLILKTLRQRLGADPEELAPARMRELHALCIRASIDALQHHDPTRGGRLAAPVSLALNRALASVPALPPSDAARRAAGTLIRLEDWRPLLSPAFTALFPCEHLRERRESLAPELARVLSLRFGWYGGPPRTVTETATILELGPRRVRSLERRAPRP